MSSLHKGEETGARIRETHLIGTMNRRSQLKIYSYDCLFPNQDTMPQVGFGNQIALPFQRNCRAAGNSLFLNGTLEPWPDPWGILAAQRRIEPIEVESLVEMASRQGRWLGVRLEPLEDGLEATPWERLPYGKLPEARIDGPVPGHGRREDGRNCGRAVVPTGGTALKNL